MAKSSVPEVAEDSPGKLPTTDSRGRGRRERVSNPGSSLWGMWEGVRSPGVWKPRLGSHLLLL